MGYRTLSHKYLKGINCEMNCETFSLKRLNLLMSYCSLDLDAFPSLIYKIKNNKGHLNCTRMCIMSY